MDAARLAYERALELDPTRVDSALRLASLCVYLGRMERASTLIDGLIARYPEAAEPLRVRALLHLASEDRRAAARDYEAALELAPGAKDARALAELYAGLGDEEAAARWRAAARRLDPSGR